MSTAFETGRHVDRPADQQIFERAVLGLPAGKSTIVFHGEGGVGKTWLFNWCRQQEEKIRGHDRRVVLNMSLDDESGAVDLLARLRLSANPAITRIGGLAGRMRAFPRFDAALALYYKQAGDQQKLSLKLQDLKSSMPFFSAVIDNSASLLIGEAVGTVFSLGALVQPILEKLSNRVDRIGFAKFRREIEGRETDDTSSLAGLLPILLARDLNELMAEQETEGLVILIDGYERLVSDRLSRGGSNRAGWLEDFHRSLDTGLVVLFSRYRIAWLTKGREEAEEGPSDMPGPFDDLAYQWDQDTIRSEAEAKEGVIYRRLGLFEGDQIRRFLALRGIPLEGPEAAKLLKGPQIPWELELTVEDIKKNPAGSAAGPSRSIIEVLRRILDPRSEQELELLKVARLAVDFSRRTLELIAQSPRVKTEHWAIDQFIASAFVTEAPAGGERWRVEPHLASRFCAPPEEVADRTGLASVREKRNFAAIHAAFSVLLSATLAELSEFDNDTDGRDYDLLISRALTYLGRFSPSFAAHWDAATIEAVVDRALKRCRELALAHMRSEALELLSKLLGSFAEKALDDASGMESGAAQPFHKPILRGAGGVELSLELLAAPWSGGGSAAFRALANDWLARLSPGHGGLADPTTRLKGYWYHRLHCRAYELFPNLRATSRADRSYFRRIGSSLERHQESLVQLRLPDNLAGLGVEGDPDHLGFLARSLLWAAARWKISDPETALEYYREAVRLLDRLVTDPATRSSFQVAYAQALVNHPDKRVVGSEREKDLRLAIRLLQGEIDRSGPVLGLLTLLERARFRLARVLLAGERRLTEPGAAASGDPDESAGTAEDGSPPPVTPETREAWDLCLANVRDVASALETHGPPTIEGAHLLLKTIRKARRIQPTLVDLDPLEGLLHRCLAVAAASPAAISRSFHYELGQLNGEANWELGVASPKGALPGRLVLDLLDRASAVASDPANRAQFAIHSARAAERAGLNREALEMRVADALQAIDAHVAIAPDMLGSLYWHRIQQLRPQYLVLVVARPVLDAQAIDLAFDLVGSLLATDHRQSVISNLSGLLEEAARDDGRLVASQRHRLICRTEETLKFAAQEDRRPYGRALRLRVQLDTELTYEERRAKLATADRIDVLAAQDVAVGARIAAAEELAQSVKEADLDLAIQTLFGLLPLADRTVEGNGQALIEARRLWGRLVWRRLALRHSQLRREYLPDPGPDPELVDRLARADTPSFVNDLLALLSTLPASSAPTPQELAVIEFDRVTTAKVRVPSRQDPEQRVLLGNLERSRAILPLSLVSVADYHAVLQPILEPIGDGNSDGYSPDMPAEEAPADGSETTSEEPAETADDHASSNADSRTSPPARDQNLPTEGRDVAEAVVQTVGMAETVAIEMTHRLVSVLRTRKEGCFVSMRGPEYVTAGLLALAPLSLYSSDHHNRIAMGASNSWACALVPARFAMDLKKRSEFFRTLLGLRRVTFVESALIPGEVGIEADIRSFLRYGFKNLRLMSLSGKAAVFSGKPTDLADLRKVRTFKSMFKKLFPGIEATFLRSSDGASSTGLAPFFGEQDVDEVLEINHGDVPADGTAEVEEVYVGNGGVNFVTVRPIGSDDTALVTRLVSRRSGLHFRAGQYLRCRYGLEHGRVCVREVEREMAESSQLVPLTVLSVDKGAYRAEVGFEAADGQDRALLPLGLLLELGRPFPKVDQVLRGRVRTDLPGGPEVIALDEVPPGHVAIREDTRTFDALVMYFSARHQRGVIRTEDPQREVTLTGKHLQPLGLNHVYPGDRLRIDLRIDGRYQHLTRVRECNRPSLLSVRADSIGKNYVTLRYDDSMVTASIPDFVRQQFDIQHLAPGVRMTVNAQVIRGGKWMVTAIRSLDFAAEGRRISGRLRVEKATGRFFPFAGHTPIFVSRESMKALVAGCDLPTRDNADLEGATIEALCAEGETGLVAVSCRQVPWDATAAAPAVVKTLHASGDFGFVRFLRPAAPPNAAEAATPDDGAPGSAYFSRGTVVLSGLNDLFVGTPVHCLTRDTPRGPVVAAMRLDPSRMLLGQTLRVQPFRSQDRVRRLSAADGSFEVSISVDTPGVAAFATTFGRYLSADIVPLGRGRYELLGEVRRASDNKIPWRYGVVATVMDKGVVIHPLEGGTKVFAARPALSALGHGALQREDLVRFATFQMGSEQRVCELDVESPDSPWQFNAVVKYFDRRKGFGYASLIDGTSDVQLRASDLGSDAPDLLAAKRPITVQIAVKGKTIRAAAVRRLDLRSLPWRSAEITWISPEQKYGFGRMTDGDGNAGQQTDPTRNIFLSEELLTELDLDQGIVGNKVFCKSIFNPQYGRMHVVDLILPPDDLYTEETADNEAILPLVCKYFDPRRGLGEATPLTGGGKIRFTHSVMRDENSEQIEKGDIFFAVTRHTSQKREVTRIISMVGREMAYYRFGDLQSLETYTQEEAPGET